MSQDDNPRYTNEELLQIEQDAYENRANLPKVGDKSQKPGPIYIKIERPEGYENVSDEIMLDDFMENPKSWEVELIGSQKPGTREWTLFYQTPSARPETILQNGLPNNGFKSPRDEVKVVELSAFLEIQKERDEIRADFQHLKNCSDVETEARNRLTAECDKWKSEYENLCKFASQYEDERDELKSLLELSKKFRASDLKCIQALSSVDDDAIKEIIDERDKYKLWAGKLAEQLEREMGDGGTRSSEELLAEFERELK